MAGGSEFGSMLRNNEIAGLVLRLTIFGVITYYGIKWLADTLDPTKKQKAEAQKKAEALMRKIGVKKCNNLTEYELTIASHLVDPLSMQISWQDIGGLDETVFELKETVILPLQKRDLFIGSSLLQPPKGVLLHGPPGCGKTMIAKATAKEAGARFINLQLSSLTDKWYGESQKLAAAVFSLAVKLQPAIIFIDEIDSFLRSRDMHDHEATAMMKAQFMSLWDGLITSSDCYVIIMGATNRPQDVDKAILRRMPAMFHIGLPTTSQRESILRLILEKEYVDDELDLRRIAEETEGFSGSDLRELCRTGAIFRVRDYISHEEEGDAVYSMRAIRQDDMSKALEKFKRSKCAAAFGIFHSPPPLD